MEDSELLRIKKEKIESLKADGVDLYPNDVKVTATTKELADRFGAMENEELEKVEEIFSVAGRIMALRDFGKASFVTIQDRKGRIQAYLRKDKLGEKDFLIFKRLEIGDIVWVSGRRFQDQDKRAYDRGRRISGSLPRPPSPSRRNGTGSPIPKSVTGRDISI